MAYICLGLRQAGIAFLHDHNKQSESLKAGDVAVCNLPARFASRQQHAVHVLFESSSEGADLHATPPEASSAPSTAAVSERATSQISPIATISPASVTAVAAAQLSDALPDEIALQQSSATPVNSYMPSSASSKASEMQSSHFAVIPIPDGAMLPA